MFYGVGFFCRFVLWVMLMMMVRMKRVRFRVFKVDLV